MSSSGSDHEAIDRHVLRKYEVIQKVGKGTIPLSLSLSSSCEYSIAEMDDELCSLSHKDLLMISMKLDGVGELQVLMELFGRLETSEQASKC